MSYTKSHTLLLLAMASALATSFITAAAPARAAVPLSVIDGWKDSAPEAIEITVLKVEESTQAGPVAGMPGCVHTRTTSTVTARINVVRRSASGLAPGNVIVFEHDVISMWPCVIPCGNSGTALAVGNRAAVYLRGDQSGAQRLVPSHIELLRPEQGTGM
jgi:hypothetical protein